MHSIWKGSLSFGLVNIPIKMYSASVEHELKFVMLHKTDLSPISYARICKAEQKEVPWKDIVKGFEYEKGEFIVLTQEDFEKANLKKTQSIEIINFASVEEIDSIYFEKPYYLEPEKGAVKAYSLLREALRKSKKVGVARFVLHNREHIALIKPFGNLLVLNQLRYADEIKEPEEVNVPAAEKSQAEELNVAIQLIDHLTKKFKPEEYKDTYTEEIKEVIAQKAKGKKVQAKGVPAKTSTKVYDIVSLLKESLKEAPKEKKSASPKNKKGSRKQSA